MTFLHYLAEIIGTKLPHLNDFYEDFDLENSTKGIYTFLFLRNFETHIRIVAMNRFTKISDMASTFQKS